MTNDELIEKTNKAIHELVYDKFELQKAYNYYNGIRDLELFKYLEENFGLGTPTSIEFTPLIRKHIDVLIGEFLDTPKIPKIACKDSETIANIKREKLLKIYNDVCNYLTSCLKKAILGFIDGKNTVDPLINKQIESIKNAVNTSFISKYEIAALDVINYIMQSRTTDLNNILRELLLDLLLTGELFYKVEPNVENTNIKIRALSPLNTFPDRNLESSYIKDSYRIVVRNWLTKTLILNKYGKDLSQDDKKLLEDHWETKSDASSYYIRNRPNEYIKDIFQGDVVVVPGRPESIYGLNTEYIPVYEVEWLETDSNYVLQRYETIRIGEDIYILKGLNEEVIRSKDNPSYCCLSVNGISFLNRGSRPYSLMLACAHLQDKYDILTFYRDKLIASSGTVGDFVDVSMLPKFLGKNMPERLEKFIAYKKGGIAPIDSSQSGRLESGQASPGALFNGFDDTIKALTIQAIQLTMDLIENTVSSITGVFRERLNGIQPRDAVTNIKLGQSNSFTITKQIYHQMDLAINEILLDALNVGKKVFKNGLTGTIVLGEEYQRIFTALPEYFTLTDYDIRITSSTEVVLELELIKQLVPQLVQALIIPPDIVFEIITSKSLTEAKQKVKQGIEKQKQDNDQLLQLNLKLQETQLQLEQASKQLEQYQKKVESLNESKLKIDKEKIDLEHQVDLFKAQTERTYREALIAEAKRRTQVELAQLTDDNPYNDRIRQLVM